MNETNQNGLLKSLFIAIAIMLLLVVGWHILLGILGITFAITASAWGVIVGTIVAISVAILLFFVFSGIGIFVVGLLAFIWAIVAIVLFPIFFSIVSAAISYYVFCWLVS